MSKLASLMALAALSLNWSQPPVYVAQAKDQPKRIRKTNSHKQNKRKKGRK
jgi:hypothetical protein